MCGNATALSLQAAGHEVSLVGRGKPVSRSGIGEHLAPQALSSLHALGLERLLADPAHLRSPGIIGSWTDGWWYCVRQTGARYVAVFLTGATDLAAAGSARKSSWRARLSTTKFGRALGDPLDPIIETWDARSMVLWPQAGPGWIAVGDAAMAFDALSAAGMTKALADATALARHLSTTDLEQDGFARLVEERRARWRNYIIGLQQTYASPSRENHPWWVGRRQWARRLGAADVQGVIDPGGEESEPEDSSAAPHR